MIEIWKRSELDKLMRKHGLRCSKALGQNFLTDKNILEKIISAIRPAGEDSILEIGPGLGTLTVLLAQAMTTQATQADVPFVLSATQGDAPFVLSETHVDEPSTTHVTQGDVTQSDVTQSDVTQRDATQRDATHGDETSALTQEKHTGLVTAVEIDSRLIPALQEATVGLSNVKIINEDFLQFDIKSHYDNSETTRPIKIIGNLPYNITTPIISKIIKDGVPFSCAVLMMQKEVAQRLVSPPGKKSYGAISVLVQYYTDCEHLFNVSREVFNPKPDVDSAVIRLSQKDLSGDDPETTSRMFRLVRSGFDMRRKTLRNSFASAGYPEEQLLAALEKAGIDPSLRAETLSAADFYKIATFL